MNVAASTEAEAVLIRRAAEGDRAAFSSLVETHRRRVYFLARDLCGNCEDAEDLAQEVFVKLYRSLHSFRGAARLSTWLHRITLNTYIDQRRSRAWKEKLQTVDLEEHTPASTHTNPGVASAPETFTLNQQVLGHVDTALDVLSPRERAAFVLRHFRDTPISEIASSMQIRQGTVKSLLFRGVRKLQGSLAHLDPHAKREGAL